MNRKEPYIGMPIDLDDLEWAGRFDSGSRFDQGQGRNDAAAPCCTKPQMQPAVKSSEPQPQPLQTMALAMAYVPWQKWTEVYPLDEGLSKGTIFPDLYFPFEGKRKGGMCR